MATKKTAQLTRELLTKELKRTTKERDDFVLSANQQIVFLNGRISMLEELINPLQAEEKPEATKA